MSTVPAAPNDDPEGDAAAPTAPSAAVCLTVRDARREVEGLLRDLAHQVTEFPFEVSIVDAWSTDGTFEYLEELASHYRTPTGGRLSVTRARGNIATGRNLAIRRTTAECILTTDAGSRLEAGWVAGMVRALHEGGAAWVASSFSPPRGSTGWHGAISATITPAREEFLAGRVLPSARGTCFWRKDFELADGYPEGLDHTEDVVFYRRLTEVAGPCSWFLEAPVEWDGRRGLDEFYRAYSNYARGDAMARIYLRRHLIRYSYYGGMTAALLLRRRGITAGAIAMFWLWNRRAWQRVSSQPATRHEPVLKRLAMASVVQVVGDVGKMRGYLLGLSTSVRR